MIREVRQATGVCIKMMIRYCKTQQKARHRGLPRHQREKTVSGRVCIAVLRDSPRDKSGEVGGGGYVWGRALRLGRG